MNNKFDANEPDGSQGDQPFNYNPARRPIRVHPNGTGAGHGNGAPNSAFTFWTFMDLLGRRWGWLFLGALMGGGALFYLGTKVVKPKFTASAKLIRYETPISGEFFKDRIITSDTFSGLIQSPDLLQRVGAEMDPPMPPEKFVKCIKIEPEYDSDMVKVFLAARSPQVAVDTLNLYLQEVEKFTKEYDQEQARAVAHDFLKSQLSQIEGDIQSLSEQFRGRTGFGPVTRKLAQVGTNLNVLSSNLAANHSPMLVDMHAQRLNSALAELQQLMVTYTERHPVVQEKQSLVNDLKKQLEVAYTNGSPSMPLLATTLATKAGEFNPEVDIIRTRLRSLEDARIELANRLHEAELFATNAPGFARIFAPATMKTVETNMRWVKISIVGIFGGLVGIMTSLLFVGLVELTERRLRSSDDLKRVTRLPVLATLGDLHKMDEHDRTQWAFRCWTMLQGRLSRSANHGLVCGVTSSANGEGRSTWISMLAEAASLAGFRVLTISTRPSPTHAELAEGDPEQVPLLDPGINEEINNQCSAVTMNALTSPAKVTEQLTGPNSQPVVHIPLPGWVWNLERRKQWRDALQHWRKIENLVILVELPPASVAEAVLLGSNLPNLVWLADAGTADAAETQAQLETLRHARCNLVGAVLNRDLSRSLKRRFARWVQCSAMVLALGLVSGQAQEGNQPPPANVVPAVVQVPTPVNPATNAYFSIVNPSQRAAWQQRLTLGAGDVLNFALYGQADLNRAEVAIAPDGTVSFLEAEQVRAAGLTIDELRTKLDEELGKFRRAPRTIVTPVQFKSKKYFILGKVMTKGVYTLDRPMTVLEAIARARGMENGLVDRNIVDLADFQRSFLIRGGQRIALNFERLFQHGDLSQNVAIEPGDYIYFPATGIQEVYVVGEIRLPGPVTYTPNTTIIAAISSRGGFTERAYKSRVIVVRGSVNSPETFAVDTMRILDGEATDFRLRPRDIIYVNSRPFIKVEELADLAFTAFIQSLISSWVGVDVVAPIQ